MSQVMHLYYFTPKTIKKLFESCGYEIMKIEPVLECGSNNIIKNIMMISWDKIAKIIYLLTGIHTNLQMTIYARKLMK